MNKLAQKIRKANFQIRNYIPYLAERRFFHFSYHKCLTVLYGQVMRKAISEIMPGQYKHFNSRIDNFYEAIPRLKFASVNNRVVEFDQIPFPFRATHFIRDPRDLVVSGYFYHKKGVEEWCRINYPTNDDWEIVNGCVPSGMKPNQSYAEFLQATDMDKGILAEIEFRKYHFRSMCLWPYDNPDILTIRYEDVLGDEVGLFKKIVDFYQIPDKWKTIVLKYAEKHSIDNIGYRSAHIRNPKSGQWRDVFTEATREAFKTQHNSLLVKLGYEKDAYW